MLKGKTAVVTGGSRGIGAATARRLVRDGWEVILNYNESVEAAMALAEELHMRAIRADVRQPEQVEALFREAGDLDLLVCCAGVADFNLLTDVSEPVWRNILSTNTDGVYRCCRAAIPAMVYRKEGCILLTSSVWGRYGASCEAAYSASKAAIIGLTKALAKELGPSHIRVNCVAPGPILTDMLTQFEFIDLAAVAEDVPLGRLGKPEDVAELFAFLASDRASYITGQIIGCDGGYGM
mgnify:CR=1 FL=1